METLGTMSMEGTSGQKYDFNIYALKEDFENTGAVYTVAKRFPNSKGSYDFKLIYIGQTEDLSRELYSHPKEDCFMAYSANAVCIHEEENEQSRIDKEKDISSKYSSVCNK